jgi:dCTP diphosphatase
MTEKRISTLLEKLFAFNRERDWEKFHSPKNLVMDLSAEVGELVEHFRWLTEEESTCLKPEILEEVKDEIGDVFKALIYLSHKLGIDPIEAAEVKLDKTSKKYPANLCKGKAVKYTKL